MAAAFSVVAIGALAGCAVWADDDAPVDPSTGTMVLLTDVAVGQCVVIAPLIEGEIEVVDCAAEGAISVLGREAVGDDAPDTPPDSAILNGYAQAACQATYDAYALEVGEPLAGKNLVSVIDETAWSGVGTSVLCAVGEPG